MPEVLRVGRVVTRLHIIMGDEAVQMAEAQGTIPVRQNQFITILNTGGAEEAWYAVRERVIYDRVNGIVYSDIYLVPDKEGQEKLDKKREEGLING